MVELLRLLLLKKVGKWRNILHIVISGVILIRVAVAANKLDGHIYNFNEQYRYFREYGSVRSRIVDKKDYRYDVCQKEFEEIGLSRNDYRLLRMWNFVDPDFYNVESCKGGWK